MLVAIFGSKKFLFMKAIKLNIEDKNFIEKLKEKLKETSQKDSITFFLITSKPINEIYKVAILEILFTQIKVLWFRGSHSDDLLLTYLTKNLSEEKLREEIREKFKVDWECKYHDESSFEEKEDWNYTFAQNIDQAFGEDEPDYSKVPLKEHNPNFKTQIWKKDQ